MTTEETKPSRLWPDVMLDLETFGNSSQAPIIQIGLCAFDIRAGEIGPTECFVVKAELDKTPADLRTVCWWLEQSAEARQRAAHAQYGDHPSNAITKVVDFLAGVCVDGVKVWAMPPEFDCVILANTFRVYGRSTPWHFANTRCLRTLEHIVGKSKTDRVKAIIAHDAGLDAMAQAQTACSYWKLLQLGAHAVGQS